MPISIRDESSLLQPLRSQGGQTLIEYILVLLVTVSIVLGGVYQLNTAFKSWASNYFGDYISCLLETGELPSIDGTPGDSGTCNQLYQPFSLTDGRPLITTNSGAGAKGGKGGGGGGRNTGGRSAAGGGGGNYGGGGGFAGGGAGQSSGYGNYNRLGSDGSNTGNTGVRYGGGYTQLNRRLDTHTTDSLDTHFAFENDRNTSPRRLPSSSNGKNAEAGSASSFKVKPISERKKPAEDASNLNFTVGNFLKWIIIAAIIIALVLLIGGQMLQVGKSME